MASSSVSQEDVDNDFELSSRRSRIRTARARTVNPPLPSRSTCASELLGGGETEDGFGYGLGERGEARLAECGLPLSGVGMMCGSGGIVGGVGGGGGAGGGPEHDASPKPLGRSKDKRGNRPNHLNKGKQQRDRRKLREKRRSTGVVHMPSTESTGGSTGEDEDEVTQNTMTAETRRNTQHNEATAPTEHRDPVPLESNLPQCERTCVRSFTSRRNKSPSDLEADDEDNQELDSLNQSDSTREGGGDGGGGGGGGRKGGVGSSSSSCSSGMAPALANNTTNGRPGTPTGETSEELLERARQENRRLLSLLEDRDRRISSLESKLAQLQREVGSSGTERDRLRQENAALLSAMTSLAAK